MTLKFLEKLDGSYFFFVKDAYPIIISVLNLILPIQQFIILLLWKLMIKF